VAKRGRAYQPSGTSLGPTMSPTLFSLRSWVKCAAFGVGDLWPDRPSRVTDLFRACVEL
jgi:hypothetical protein